MSSVRMVRFNSITLKAEPDSERNNNKQNDALYSEADFGFFYAVCFVISIITFAVDILLHCWLAYLFYMKTEMLYFVLTITFIIVPSIVSTGFSMRWYILDEDDETSPSKPSLIKWSLRILTMLLQITQIHRYFDALLYGLRSSFAGCRKQLMKQDYLYRKMLDEDCDAALLRLFYCVLNSAPQAVLQLTILLTYRIEKTYKFEDLKFLYASVGVSIFSIAWSLTVYNRTVRYIREDKKRLSFMGTVMNFISQFSWAVSRVFALSVFATWYPKFTLLGCLIHTSLMSVWLMLKQDVNHSRCDECVLSCMLGIAYIFVFIPSHGGPQRYSYLSYYSICLLENIGCLYIWYSFGAPITDVDLYYGMMIVQVFSFFASLFFLVLYYRCFHPNRRSIGDRVYEIRELNSNR
ncbi:XK-related protein 7-like [Planococcus citri]|uniref:XK-related protein 7-like n=1 Tax=Planococcus citri TaxID=170843 RepID=UPI0031F9F747